MREIRFRTWDKSRNKMFYDVQETSCYWNGVFNHDVIQEDNFGDVLDKKDIYEVMQFTGLYDKNKVPIYEGDILLRKTRDDDEWATIVLVKYGKVEFSFLHKLYNRRNDPHTRWQRGTYQGLETYGEVIGNIYENSDLLGE